MFGVIHFLGQKFGGSHILGMLKGKGVRALSGNEDPLWHTRYFSSVNIVWILTKKDLLNVDGLVT